MLDLLWRIVLFREGQRLPNKPSNDLDFLLVGRLDDRESRLLLFALRQVYQPSPVVRDQPVVADLDLFAAGPETLRSFYARRASTPAPLTVA